MKKKVFSLELLLIPTIGLTMFLIACFIGSFRFFTDSFFKSFSDLFMDYFDSIRYAAKFDAYSSFNVLYSPLVNLYFMFCSFFIPRSALDPNVDRYVMQHQPMAYILLAIYFIICFILLFYSLKKVLKKQSKAQIIFIYCLLIFSYPFLYTMERGNTLLLAFVLVVFFCAFYDSDKKYQHELALIALALSTTIKLYPVILALFLIKRKAWKDITKYGIYTTLLLFLPFIFYGGLEGMITMFSSSLNFFGEMLHCFSNIYLLLYYGFGVNIVLAKVINYIVIALFVVNFFIVKKRYQEFGALILIFLCTPPGTESYMDIFFLVVLLLLIVEKEHGYLELAYLANLLLFLTFNTSTWLMTFATMYYVGVFYILHLIVMPLILLKKKNSERKKNVETQKRRENCMIREKLKSMQLGKIANLFFFISITLVVLWLIQLTLNVALQTPHVLLNNSVFHHHLGDSFADFFNVNAFYTNFSPYIEYDSSYPPMNFIIAFPFSMIQKRNPYLSLGFFIALYLSFLSFILYLVIKKYKLTAGYSFKLGLVFMLSAPFLFVFERGNYLVLTFCFVSLFLLTYDSENRVIRELSYLWIAIAAACKLYPAVFAIILLKERRFLDLGKAALYTVILIIFPFFLTRDGFITSISGFIHNLQTFSAYNRLCLDVSTSNFFKIMAYLFGLDHTAGWVSTVGSVFKYLMFILMALGMLFSKKKWQTLTLAGLCSAVIPSPAIIHSMIFSLIGLFVFLLEENHKKIDYFYMALFLVIVMPLQLGFIIKPIPYSLQRIGIGDVYPYYLGLTVNVLLESLACLLLAATISLEILVPVAKNYLGKMKHKNNYENAAK